MEAKTTKTKTISEKAKDQGILTRTSIAASIASEGGRSQRSVKRSREELLFDSDSEGSTGRGGTPKCSSAKKKKSGKETDSWIMATGSQTPDPEKTIPNTEEDIEGWLDQKRAMLESLLFQESNKSTKHAIHDFLGPFATYELKIRDINHENVRLRDRLELAYVRAVSRKKEIKEANARLEAERKEKETRLQTYASVAKKKTSCPIGGA